MSRLTRDDILKLALLSRLRLSEEEIDRFGTELSKILDFESIKAQIKGIDIVEMVCPWIFLVKIK